MTSENEKARGHFRGDILEGTFWKGHFDRDFLSLRHQKRDNLKGDIVLRDIKKGTFLT